MPLTRCLPPATAFLNHTLPCLTRDDQLRVSRSRNDGKKTYEFLRANLPILPIFLIIILALLTVELRLILSVLIFRILKRLLLPFSFSFSFPPPPPTPPDPPASPMVFAVRCVRSVSASETSLLIAW